MATPSTAAISSSPLSAPKRPSSHFSPTRFLDFLHILFLFTASDLKTVVFPKTLVGTLNGLSGLFSASPTPPSTSAILSRTPLILLWTWLNLLPFNINNQRRPDAIVEDLANKSWRPLPSNLLTPSTAFSIMLAGYVAALTLSWYLHALPPSLALIVLGFAYNDLRGGDRSCISRNTLNACLYLSFITGASMVALGHTEEEEGQVFNSSAWTWLLMLGATVITTGHMQDIPDRVGDAAKGRRTVPLVVGDRAARWTVALGTLAWSVVLPSFWGARWWVYGGMVGLA
ncbi:MAG: hypothetical protein Q9184_008266, partial [Pyrenodesmia sp. 2 TL-2023]